MELNIDKILKQIEEYGKEKNYNIEDIVSIKHDFLKQTIFNKFVMQSDENNGNWAIIEDKIKLIVCFISRVILTSIIYNV